MARTLATSFRPPFRLAARALLYALALLAALTLAPPARAQLPPPSAAAELPSQEQLQERIRGLESATGMDEALRNRLLESYRLALDRLAAANGAATATRQYQEALQGAPAQLSGLRSELERLRPSPFDPREVQNLSLGELQQRLSQEKATLAALQSQLAELEDQLRTQQARPSRAQQELAEARLRRDAAEQELQTPPPEGEDERLRDARRAALLAQHLASSNQIRMLEQELLSHEARLGLLNARHDLVGRRLAPQSERVRQLQEIANERSRAEAAEVAESAERAVQEAPEQLPLLRQVAATNAELSAQLTGLVNEIERTGGRAARLQEQLDQLRRDLASTEQQLEIAGLDKALGELLRRQRQGLPDVDEHARLAAQRQEQISNARLRQFQLQEQRRGLPALEREVESLLDAAEGLSPSERDALGEQLRQLLQDRRALMEKLALTYGRHIDQLTSLHTDEAQLVEQAERYSELLDENLFWIASAEPVGPGWLRNLGRSLAWLVEPDKWQAVGAASVRAALAKPAISIAVLLILLVVRLLRPRLRTRLRTLSALTTDPTRDRFAHTVQALLITFLFALPWPVLIALGGWLLTVPIQTEPFTHAVGQGLRQLASVALIIELFRQLCRTGGVAHSHFRWRSRSRRLLRRNLSWLLAITLPLAFLITVMEWQPDELHRDTLGRLSFVLASIALGVFAWRVLRPGALPLRQHRRERRSGWWRLRKVLRTVSVLVPLALAALALYGYYYTALQLESRLITTGWLLIGLAILANLVLRWIRISERRMSATAPVDPAQPAARAGGLTLSAIDEQTRTLLHLVILVAAAVGLWLIWSDLLPALNLFQQVVLWEQLGADGEPTLTVTLADLALALLLLALTVIAASNLPGVLEITLLSRLSVDPGNRYAISSICRYLIVGVGIVVVLGMMGLRWSQLQWLVAALGVGLGFGLQEIFANFISGLILLFERPIRVGDTVTVGEMTGTVSRIRIRATTITDWDRKELIIPNKTFITERLTNWTLSDDVTRVVLRLRLPFGADPEQIRQLLLEAARENPRVLADPEPSAWFREIGEDCLHFALYAYCDQLSDRLPITHELYSELQWRLREQGITLPYPQRDLHIRSVARREPMSGGDLQE